MDDPSSLISETDVKCIFVVPGYRLGVFGFLASEELWQHASDSVPAANFGFWDQRLAIEWTYDNIQCFGGNKYNITVGGLSAGSYSAFHQVCKFELFWDQLNFRVPSRTFGKCYQVVMS